MVFSLLVSQLSPRRSIPTLRPDTLLHKPSVLCCLSNKSRLHGLLMPAQSKLDLTWQGHTSHTCWKIHLLKTPPQHFRCESIYCKHFGVLWNRDSLLTKTYYSYYSPHKHSCLFLHTAFISASSSLSCGFTASLTVDTHVFLTVLLMLKSSPHELAY